MARLPDLEDPKAFYDLLFRPGQWDEAIAEIRRRHGLSGTFEQSTNGSTVVFLSEEHCIKLHPPFPGFTASHHREVAALECVASELPIPTPEVRGHGELAGWRYFVSTRLRGQAIDAVWNDLDAAVRLDLATQLGEAIAAMHQLAASRVAALTEPWAEFRPLQRGRCLDVEAEKGSMPDRLAELDRFLRRTDAIDAPKSMSSLLHTEIGPSHVLVEDGRITGLIDFGDAMVGDPEYDLAPVGLFVTRGDRAAFRTFGLAYGLDAADLGDPNRPARLLRHAVLHRYATLAWYLDVLDPPPGSLEDLAEHWFGVEPQH